MTKEIDPVAKRLLPNTILMQYTGLKDKNGNEIYEGDIIKIDNDMIEEEIDWVDEKNWMDEKCPVRWLVNHQSIYKKPIEVIGNIYANPELLEVPEMPQFKGTQEQLDKLTIRK